MHLPTRQDGVENRDKVYYKGSKNEIKNLTIFNCKEYKRQQLLKHQLFTADVDINGWLIRSWINNVSFILQW